MTRGSSLQLVGGRPQEPHGLHHTPPEQRAQPDHVVKSVQERRRWKVNLPQLGRIFKVNLATLKKSTPKLQNLRLTQDNSRKGLLEQRPES